MTPEATDFSAYGTRVSVYALSPGQAIDRHAHRAFGHKLIVATGLARFTKELHVREIHAPCMVAVAPGEEHELVAISPSVVISIFDEREKT